ncbi:MAG: CcmD family protein [Salibacteraceae bacterium]|jgi:multisubunit Na+/H+ antiporter MnhB subunit|nr:CcmD family protein [Salibacteraceae bacterium]MDP4687475.1 CcmD family protein [Salibacteraceae bacterium]MDP4762530.1 CcmD family protein [Salibacteraceae bacterium]MDP4844029.1 CcmD family protein [Salibacteraceae bacterium]MDP4933652.1 CcmD family protein [Salibacteraceae bacterium]
MRQIISTLVLMLLFTITNAQTSQPEMADLMRENGKIYVVVGVIVLIFLVLFGYLISLDRKISKIEKDRS